MNVNEWRAEKKLDSMDRQQILPFGTIMCTISQLRTELIHEIMRLKRFEYCHQASLSSGSLAVSLLGPTWRCRRYLLAFVRTVSALLLQENLYARIPTCWYAWCDTQHGKNMCNKGNSHRKQTGSTMVQFTHSPRHATSCHVEQQF